MLVSKFNSHNSLKVSGEGSITEYLQNVRNGEWQDLILKARLLKQQGDLEAYKSIKIRSGGIMCHGTFADRNQNSLIKHSGFVCLDIDHLDGQAHEIKARLIKDKYTYACHLSMGGDGLCVWVAAKIKADGSDHRYIYDRIAAYYAEMYDIETDVAASALGKCRAYSWDSDLYHNPQSDVYKAPAEVKAAPKEYKTAFTESDFDQLLQQVRSRGINLCGNYHDWVNIGLALASEFGEAGRDAFHVFSQPYEKYDYAKVDRKFTDLVKARGTGRTIGIGSIFYLCKQQGCEITSKTTQKVVAIARQVKRSGGNKDQLKERVTALELEVEESLLDKAMALPADVSADLSVDDQIVLFLKSNYSIRYNIIKAQVEIDGKQINDRLFNDIYLQVKAQVDDKVKTDQLNIILNSSNFEDYDFVKDYYNSIPEKPITFIDTELTFQLAVSLGGAPSQTAFNHEFLLRWGVAFVYQSLAIKHYQNTFMLVLTGVQDGGKTSFLRGLLPPEFEPYIKEKVQGDTDKDLVSEAATYVLIIDDEFQATSKAQIENLKATLSRQTLTQRPVYGRYDNIRLRRASYAATSNQDDLIADITGNRRILPFRTDQINWQFYNQLDKRALLAEWVNMYRSGWDYRLTKADIAKLNQIDAEFKAVYAEEELLKRYFRPAQSIAFCLKMTNTDILAKLQQWHPSIRLSGKILGQFLKKIGFKKKGNFYEVEEIPTGSDLVKTEEAPF
jgi:predicted P-loop ATPase